MDLRSCIPVDNPWPNSTSCQLTCAILHPTDLRATLGSYKATKLVNSRSRLLYVVARRQSVRRLSVTFVRVTQAWRHYLFRHRHCSANYPKCLCFTNPSQKMYRLIYLCISYARWSRHFIYSCLWQLKGAQEKSGAGKREGKWGRKGEKYPWNKFLVTALMTTQSKITVNTSSTVI